MELDDEIIKYVKSSGFFQGFNNLERLILSRDDDLILGFIDKRSRDENPGQAIMEYVRALFSALGYTARDDHSARPAKLLLLVVMKCLTLYQLKKIPNDRKCMDCYDFFVQELDALPKQLLPSITEFITSDLKAIIGTDDGYQLQLLPRCLSLIMSATEVTVPGQAGEGLASSGPDYARFVLNRILRAKWSKVMLTRMVSILREMQLDKSQVEGFLKKVFGRMERAEPQDLPALVYQLLLFASKGHKKAILGGIVKLFGELMSRVSDEHVDDRRGFGSQSNAKKPVEVLRQVEGTVLLHMNFAIKQDHSLRRELLNVVRADHRLVSPFTVALLLSIARIQRFEEPSMGLLRTIVVKAHQDYRQARECRWLPDIIGMKSLETAKAMEQAVLQAVQNSSFGRDYIIPSVVKIGFNLLEFIESGKMVSIVDSCDGIVGSRKLGIQALRMAFEVHEMARNEIIEQSKFRIISLKPQQSSSVIRLLDQLVQGYPHLMLEHVARLKECLDYFTFLSSESASSFIKAICPLFRMSRDLQNYTVLVLRKAMFGREEAGRVAATRAMIDLIISQKKSSNNDSDTFLQSSSQACCRQQIKHSCTTGLNLFQELKGLLQRCLSQQARVKEAMYKGFVNLVLVHPAGARAVFDLLWPHFCRFCVPQEDRGLQLKLTDCIKIQNGSLCLEEPLDHLLSCVYRLLVLQPQNKTDQWSEYSWTCFGFSLSQENEVGGVPSGESFASAFANLRKSFQTDKLGEYNLDRTQNFGLESLEGEKNVEQARILLGILEVFIDAVVSDMGNATDTDQTEAKSDLSVLLEMFNSVEQLAFRKQGNVPRKGFIKPALDTKRQTQESGNQLNVNVRHGSNSTPLNSAQDRIPFLMTSSIAHLLKVTLKLNKTDMCTTHSTSQHRSQGTSRKQNIYQFQVASFALKTCLRHLKALSSEVYIQGESQGPLKTLVDDDIKVLGGPLLKVICLLKSGSSCGASTQDKTKRKEGRGKKGLDEAGEGLIYTALLCMHELCKLSFVRCCLTDMLEEMLCVSSDNEDMVHELDCEMEDVHGNNSDCISESPQVRLIQQFLWKKIRPLLVELLTLSHFREFEVLSSTMLLLGSKLPSQLRNVHGSWAELTCRNIKVVHNGASRALATLAVHLSIPPLDLTVAQGMACALLKVMGSDEQDAVDISEAYAIINASTRNGIATLLLQFAEAILVDVEWLTSKLKALPIAVNLELSEDNANSQRRGNTPRLILEDTLHSRVESLVQMLFFFAEMNLKTTLAEHFLRVASRLYKILAAMTKFCIAPKGYKQTLPSSKFQMLAEVTCEKLTAPLYKFMAVMQREQQENLQDKGAVNKIKRECKTIPNLIFHLEDYEKYLIQLSKLTKVNLMRHAKHSTARDFKILDTGRKKQEEVNNEPEEPNRSDAAVSDSESEEHEAEGSECVPASESIAVAEEIKSDSDNELGMKIKMPQKRKIVIIIQDSDEE